MALLHQAVLKPTKLELLNAWLPTRSWYDGEAPLDLTRVAAWRFDDPDGEVGIETMLVQAGDGPVFQIPLTYRGAPLEGADDWLVGTSDHSVLGQRWVYDGCGDPVYVQVVSGIILTGGTQAEEFIEVDGELQRREPTVSVRGSGSAATGNVPSVGAQLRVDDADPTVITTDAVELTVLRRLDGAGADEPVDGGYGLSGSWRGQASRVLVRARRL